MKALDVLFEEYPVDGFQDIWFHGLEPTEVANLFNYACQKYGHGASHAIWNPDFDDNSDEPSSLCALSDVYYTFKPLIIETVSLDGVAIRIEDDNLAIDFDSGLEYWNSVRQSALMHWLRDLWNHAPHAVLDWAHEGSGDRPCQSQSELLRSAVMGDANLLNTS